MWFDISNGIGWTYKQLFLNISPRVWDWESAGVPTNLDCPLPFTYLRTVCTDVLRCFSSLVKTPRSKPSTWGMLLHMHVLFGLGLPCRAIQNSTRYTWAWLCVASGGRAVFQDWGRQMIRLSHSKQGAPNRVDGFSNFKNIHGVLLDYHFCPPRLCSNGFALCARGYLMVWHIKQNHGCKFICGFPVRPKTIPHTLSYPGDIGRSTYATWFIIHSNRLHRPAKLWCGCSRTHMQLLASTTKHANMHLGWGVGRTDTSWFLLHFW